MAQGVLFVAFGIWLLLQTLVGDLPKRILSWRAMGSSDTVIHGSPIDPNAHGGAGLVDPFITAGGN